MRFTVTTGGRDFHLRTFHGREFVALTKRLGILPVLEAPGGVAQTWRIGDLADDFLVLCSISPKLVKGDPEPIPDGVVPLNELTDAEYFDVANALFQKSWYSAEATDDVRPTVGTTSP